MLYILGLHHPIIICDKNKENKNEKELGLKL